MPLGNIRVENVTMVDLIYCIELNATCVVVSLIGIYVTTVERFT